MDILIFKNTHMFKEFKIEDFKTLIHPGDFEKFQALYAQYCSRAQKILDHGQISAANLLRADVVQIYILADINPAYCDLPAYKQTYDFRSPVDTHIYCMIFDKD